MRNEIETKRNETERNETKSNETKRNETKPIETKRNEIKRSETKRRYISFRFVSFRSVSLRFVWFRFVSFGFVSFRFRFASHFTGTPICIHLDSCTYVGRTASHCVIYVISQVLAFQNLLVTSGWRTIKVLFLFLCVKL